MQKIASSLIIDLDQLLLTTGSYDQWLP